MQQDVFQEALQLFSLVNHFQSYPVLRVEAFWRLPSATLPRKKGPQMEFHHFLIVVLHYERAAPGNLRTLDCVFHPNDFIEGTTV